MTVAELIEKLKEFDPNLQVATPVPDPSWGQPEFASETSVALSVIQHYDYETKQYIETTVLAIGYDE